MAILTSMLLVGLGGSIGACLRFLVSGAMPSINGLPTGTLTVNTIGTFILAFFTYSTIGSDIIYPVTIGTLGSFTTFSTFAYESFHLMEEGSFYLSFTNIASNVTFCLIGAGLGWLLATLI
ncbi:CrcB protein [Methanohalophilus levihalophilus]|uniref:fluoride efflux transporter FluC n=1 Tax=Methanohalophilus levihalophilus TaxID=1431282 RepID=UPI001AE327C9|nr:CrcB family protein [Methanohalophilus levihalophilus]MBP2030847.1 CrcB protein [Methanohalophilus levihalophilus]